MGHKFKEEEPNILVKVAHARNFKTIQYTATIEACLIQMTFPTNKINSDQWVLLETQKHLEEVELL